MLGAEWHLSGNQFFPRKSMLRISSVYRLDPLPCTEERHTGEQEADRMEEQEDSETRRREGDEDVSRRQTGA